MASRLEVSATEQEPTAGSAGRGLLAGRRILVTGVLTDRSLAYRAAERMQQMGAEIVLTGFGRGRRITERAAQYLPEPPDVLELDVLKPEDFGTLAADLTDRWGRVDGILHSIAFAPPEVFDAPFFEVPHESLDVSMRASVYSLKDLAGALLPLLEQSPGGASLLALTVMERALVHSYAWMAVTKAALNSLVKQMAVQLAPSRVRVNLLACGPVKTNAGSVIPGLDQLAEDFRERAPLGWDDHDFGIVAGPAGFMLSELSCRVTGEMLHVDGGRHVVL